MNILLDFDGVVFDNKRVQSIVTERSVDFVKRRMNLKSTREARYINNSTYPVKGHTALIFDNPNVIHDYNQCVFDESLLYYTRSLVDSRDRAHAERFLSLRKRVPQKYRFHLCTNATRSYCEHVLHALNMPVDYEHIFTSEDGMVKPLNDYWARVEDTIPSGKLTLIDDSPLNIIGVSTLPRWDAVLINQPSDLYRFLELLVSDNF